MSASVIYPRPQRLRHKAGEAFTLGPATPILATAAARTAAVQLQRWLHEDHGLSLRIEAPATGRKGILVGLLADAATQDALRERDVQLDGREAVHEGYLLDSGREQVVVAGHDAAGTFYGLQLLRQLVVRDPSAPRISGAEAHDWPYKPMRGVHLYMPPRRELPFFDRFLEFLASLRFNTIFLEVGGGMRYDRHPEINKGWEDYVRRALAFPGGIPAVEHGFPWPKNSTHYELAGGSYLEKDEVRGILERARALHIEVFPEVQSLSHSYYLCYPHPEIAERQDDPFPDTYCPSNPASYELLFDVMEEVIEVFQPRVIHTGHDETYLYGICPRCRGKSGAELIGGDINRIHDFLAGKGIRMAMWGDKLMNIIVGGRPEGGRERRIPAGTWFRSTEEFVMPETYQAVDAVPRDILILNWYWGVDPAAEEYFGRLGFEQIYGNLGHHGRWAFTGWDRKTAPAHVLGGEVSTWCEVSEYAYGHDLCIFTMMFSAGPLWWGRYCDRERERVLDAVAALQPAMRDRLGGRCSPSLAPGATFQPFPLGGAANVQTCFAGELQGRVELGGAPFELGGAGANAVRVDRDVPEARAIPVGARAASLLFLHHCRCERKYFTTWGDHYIVLPTPEGVLGWYRVTYADGSEEKVELNYGESIARCDVRYGEDLASCPYWCEPVWEGRDEEGGPVVLYRYEWANPHPEKEIVSVQLVSARGEGEIQLVGLTGVHASV